jgi:hypothetical protein
MFIKKPEFLPPIEIKETIKICVKECHGATKKELERSIPKQLGITTSSQKLRAIVSKEIDRLISSKEISLT